MPDLNEGVSPRNPKLHSLGIYDRATILWSWLFPLSYLIHIAEEYWGGEGLSSVHPPHQRCAYVNGAVSGSAERGIYPGYNRRDTGATMKFLPMMLVILGTVVAGNALTHTSPRSAFSGMDQAVLFNLHLGALGIATLIHFKSYIDDKRQYWIAIAIGVELMWQ